MNAILICVLTIIVVTQLEVDAKCCKNVDTCTEMNVVPGSKHQEKFQEACKFHNVCLCCGKLENKSKKTCDKKFKHKMKKSCKKKKKSKCLQDVKSNYEHAKNKSVFKEKPPKCCKKMEVKKILDRQ